MTDQPLVVRRVGPESAAQVLAVVRAAFEARPPLDPPAAALGETEESIRRSLSGTGGLLACRAARARVRATWDKIQAEMAGGAV